MNSKDRIKEAKRKYSDRVRFGGHREETIIRDGGRCVRCGLPRILSYFLFGCDLSVNHIDGRGRNHPQPNHDPKNLETLCRPCHGYYDAPKTSGKFLKYAPPVEQIYKYQLWLLCMDTVNNRIIINS